jgi:hypothetical protein
MDKKALVGIKRPDGIYTVIGEEFVYYLTASGKEGQIANNDLLIILRENALAKGKRGHFEFLQVNEQDAVWFLDMKVMNAMWNLILLLNRVITGKKL